MFRRLSAVEEDLTSIVTELKQTVPRSCFTAVIIQVTTDTVLLKYKYTVTGVKFL